MLLNIIKKIEIKIDVSNFFNDEILLKLVKKIFFTNFIQFIIRLY